MAGFGAATDDVLTGIELAAFGGANPVAFRHGVFDHGDAVGAGRNWRAGHDLDGCSRREFAVLPDFSSAYLANDTERFA